MQVARAGETVPMGTLPDGLLPRTVMPSLPDPVNMRKLIEKVQFKPDVKNDKEQCPLGKIDMTPHGIHLYSNYDKGAFFGADANFILESGNSSNEIQMLTHDGVKKCKLDGTNILEENENLLSISNDVMSTCTKLGSTSGEDNSIEKSGLSLQIKRVPHSDKMTMSLSRTKNGTQLHCEYTAKIPVDKKRPQRRK
jgi:hypothetical protein